MSDLAAWLLSCADTDEREAREATPGPWEVDPRGDVRTNAGTVEDLIGWDSAAHAPKMRTIQAPVIEDCDGCGPALTGADATFIARHDPARVLADCAALRAAVEILSVPDPHDPGEGCEACDTLRILAQPFKGRDGWQDEWGMP
jgi:hypothetical protein